MLVALGPLHILLHAYAAGLTARAAALGQGMGIIGAVLEPWPPAGKFCCISCPAIRASAPRCWPTPLHVVLHHIQRSNRGERRLADRGFGSRTTRFAAR